MSCDKESYLTQREANDARRVVRGRRSGPIYLRTYFCAICHAWHLTSQLPSETRFRNIHSRRR